MLEITPEITIRLSELQFTYVRSSGPGGQNVNKVSSKAVMRWKPEVSETLPAEVIKRLREQYPSYWTNEGEIIITSQKTRDAPKNREDCIEKLKTMLTKAAQIPKPRIPTRRTKGSIRRRLDEKARHAIKKQFRKKIDREE